MAYDAFDASKPAIADTRANVVAETFQNVNALRDMVVGGGDGSVSWAWAITAGTNDKPTEIVLSSGVLRQRWTLVWSSENITSITFAKSVNSGGAYDTVGSFTFTRSGDDVTGGNVGSFVLGFLMKVAAEARGSTSGFSAHVAATGTAVHGLGTMSTQTATAVNIDGGTIDGTIIGSATPTDGRFTRVLEVHSAVAFASPTTTLAINTASSFSFTATGSGAVALAFTGAPSTDRLQTVAVWITNGGLRTWTWPAGTVWAGGSAPAMTSSGLDILTFTTKDGGTTWAGAVFGKAFA